jgi:uncharacterized protein YdcH (DUF465 family)
MSTPVKEARSRIRCSKCGRVLRSQQSRARKLCCICDADENLDKIWARRIKLEDDALLQLLQQKVKLKDDELLRFLQKKVGLK